MNMKMRNNNNFRKFSCRMLRLPWFLSFIIGTLIFLIFSNFMGSDYGRGQTKLASVSTIGKWLSLMGPSDSQKLGNPSPTSPLRKPIPELDARQASKIVQTIDDYLLTFIDKLINIRTVHLKNMQPDHWEPLPQATDLIDADFTKFLTQIRNIRALQTITINISFNQFFNKLPWVGYEYGGNDCFAIESRSEYGNNAASHNAGYGNRYFKSSCKNVTSLIKQIPFETSLLDIGYLPFMRPRKEELGEVIALTYLHIAQNAVATQDGDVFVGKYKLSPQRCMAVRHTGGYPEEEMPLYDEVFTIAQFWGEGYFHFMNEEFPRLAAWVVFLNRYPDVKIHVNSQHYFIETAFQALGLSPSRIIVGNIRAQLLYAPAGTPCGAQTYFNTKLLALRLQENIFNRPLSPYLFDTNETKLFLNSSFPTKADFHKAASPASLEEEAGNSKHLSNRKYIVLIKRSTKRYFTYHIEIFGALLKLANERGLEVVVFDDTRLPSYTDTVTMFHNALAVVGPHGAGFSNMLFSQPGTIIIEGLCYKDGFANLCYRNLAKIIGLRYYGILLEEDCLEIKAHNIIPPLTQFLDLLKVGAD